MSNPQLILALPTGNITASSLGVEGLARRRSPGSGKHFSGRSIFIELAMNGDAPGFNFLDEGGWRDPMADSIAAIAGVKAGSKTKTAVSNYGFNCVPLSAFRQCYLAKTGGALLPLANPTNLIQYSNHTCTENLTSNQVADAVGRAFTGNRVPRLYMVIRPTQFIMLSNLTPEEYGWYATHRPGKIFRQVMFTEISQDQPHIAAQSRFSDARTELLEKETKKTKTIVFEDCLNRIPFSDWTGYRRETEGGLYVGDRNRLMMYPFPESIPSSWDRLEG